MDQQFYHASRHHFRHPQAMFNKGSLLYSHFVFTLLLGFQLSKTWIMITLVYGSILPPTSLYQRIHKTKQPLLHLGILTNVNIFYKIVDISQKIKKKIQLKNGKLRCSIIFIIISVLTLSVKRSGGGWEEEAPFQRNEATICHVSRR
jgi:hypothetical protein